MIRKIKLHDAAAKLAELLALRRHLHAGHDRRRARSRKAFHAFDLHEAKPARTECIEQLGRAELRDRDARFGSGAQHRRASRDTDVDAVDRERDGVSRWGLRRAEVGFSYGTHVELLRVAALLSPSFRRRPESSLVLNEANRWIPAFAGMTMQMACARAFTPAPRNLPENTAARCAPDRASSRPARKASRTASCRTDPSARRRSARARCRRGCGR